MVYISPRLSRSAEVIRVYCPRIIILRTRRVIELIEFPIRYTKLVERIRIDNVLSQQLLEQIRILQQRICIELRYYN